MKLEDSKKVTSLIPFKDIEEGAIKQFEDVLSYKQVKHISIMPDTHQGYFAPIGSVILVEGYVSPTMVGSDQNCGMCYLDTGILVNELISDERSKTELVNKILRSIPLSSNRRKVPLPYKKFESAYNKYIPLVDFNLDERINSKLFKQLGSLGSGNHFIEIGSTMNGTLAICIHSGSRNPGYTLAEHYIKFGNFIPENSPIGKAFIEDLAWSEKYAFDNRKIMMELILRDMDIGEQTIQDILIPEMINESHNTMELTSDGLWLHRKGATPAEKGQLGIIPGNMRDGTVVTRGKGNTKYSCSAPHGAGRDKSRTKARNTLSLDEFKRQMEGIATNGIGKKKLDEAPNAYKDFDHVLELSEPVVEIIDRLTPIINIKG